MATNSNAVKALTSKPEESVSLMEDMQNALNKPKKRERKTDEQLLAAARMLAEGSTVKDALLVAGYSPAVAAKGTLGITGRLKKYVLKEGLKMSEIGRGFNAQQQEDAVRGGLMWKAALERDVKALELLGKDKRVNMFASEAMTGVIVLQLPQTIANNLQGSLPVIEGEVVDDLPALPQLVDSKE